MTETTQKIKAAADSKGFSMDQIAGFVTDVFTLSQNTRGDQYTEGMKHWTKQIREEVGVDASDEEIAKAIVELVEMTDEEDAASRAREAYTTLHA